MYWNKTMLAFFSVEDSEKRAGSVHQLKNTDSSILLKKNSLTQSFNWHREVHSIY